jgi:hypothetical protein
MNAQAYARVDSARAGVDETMLSTCAWYASTPNASAAGTTAICSAFTGEDTTVDPFTSADRHTLRALSPQG